GGRTISCASVPWCICRVGPKGRKAGISQTVSNPRPCADLPIAVAQARATWTQSGRQRLSRRRARTGREEILASIRYCEADDWSYRSRLAVVRRPDQNCSSQLSRSEEHTSELQSHVN